MKASFEECARRDVKGLYAKAAQGGVKQFTGKDSGFEEPVDGDFLVLDTESESAEESARQLSNVIFGRIAG